ncbi:MAG: nucleotidyltransferase domain-containing protein, partial [Bacillota bacterium]|nr:nucleotidyltransferase domain-containing protein [Bacillota bacterium]
MSYNLDQSIINDIKKIADKYEKIDKITLFGSRARGDNKASSDIDLAVYCNESFKDESRVYFDLEDINTLLKLDIIFVKKNTDKKLMENIKREGVIIYE